MTAASSEKCFREASRLRRHGEAVRGHSYLYLLGWRSGASRKQVHKETGNRGRPALVCLCACLPGLGAKGCEGRIWQSGASYCDLRRRESLPHFCTRNTLTGCAFTAIHSIDDVSTSVRTRQVGAQWLVKMGNSQGWRPFCCGFQLARYRIQLLARHCIFSLCSGHGVDRDLLKVGTGRPFAESAN